MYKIRIILDTKEDVIRTILVDESITLESLHRTIAASFGFEGQQMASFYRTDDEWNQGEEIPLFNMAEAGEEISMETCFVDEILPEENSKLIYVYDFLKMWTFYVDVVEISSEVKENLPETILSFGEIPEKEPKKEFVADNFGDDFDDEDIDDLDENHGHYDDYDFTDY
ncbi:hypothetical protein [uncultured Polaribacter sp.]|uniref:IS1096 element passenger TnpR family protein n=1 Tax=uncultured Polaribacter sp. TaxID=174711 RepID=UPI0030D75948|tara:strand:+ start:647 stop:1153 length:507 start_codon:yes stop_codon:yes gene_type:complete